MDQLYLKIMEQLRDNVIALKYIDYDNGQIDVFEEYPCPFPCALIDFNSVDWQDIGEKVQLGDVRIQIRLAFDLYEDINSLTPATSRNAGLTKLQLLNDIHHALQGFGGTHFNRLSRISSTVEKRNDALKVYNLIYICNMQDNHAHNNYTTTNIETLTVQPE